MYAMYDVCSMYAAYVKLCAIYVAMYVSICIYVCMHACR